MELTITLVVSGANVDKFIGCFNEYGRELACKNWLWTGMRCFTVSSIFCRRTAISSGFFLYLLTRLISFIFDHSYQRWSQPGRSLLCSQCMHRASDTTWRGWYFPGSQNGSQTSTTADWKYGNGNWNLFGTIRHHNRQLELIALLWFILFLFSDRIQILLRFSITLCSSLFK